MMERRDTSLEHHISGASVMTALGQSNVNQSECEILSRQKEGARTLLHGEGTEQRGISPSCSSLAF